MNEIQKAFLQTIIFHAQQCKNDLSLNVDIMPNEIVVDCEVCSLKGKFPLNQIMENVK